MLPKKSRLLPACPHETPPAFSRRDRAAFTLVELLVVIAIIGVLASLLLPVMSSVAKTADKTNCMSNLRQITVAANMAAADNNNQFLNMHGYSWEPGDTWIADGLAPYLGGNVGKDPTKVLRCPAALKNQQEAWLTASQYCHYRYNIYRNPNSKPLYSLVNAMVFFDTTYPDWTPAQFAHSPGGGAVVNVGYADGHTAALSYADYKKLNPTMDDTQNDFFKLGWLK